MRPDPRYPIGEFSFPEATTTEQRREWIRDIAEAPALLRAAVSGLSEQQLDTPYRPGGWTARQVVHHLADSHMNSYVRFKLALTEESPVIKPYDEVLWANLPDGSSMPIEPSLSLIEGLHSRWVRLLESMSETDFLRAFHHPESGTIRLEQNLAHYAWHGKHHVAHVMSIR
jgi:uncharacterized damage-inducible protein DinB